MPGIVMDDASVTESRHWINTHDVRESNGDQDSATRAENNGAVQGLEKTSRYLNGSDYTESSHRMPDMTTEQQQESYTTILSEKQTQRPPDLLHITQGFFPYSQLVNRAVQQCWNDLSDLITELAEVQISTQPQQQSATALTNGKASNNQSTENVQKKLRILEFAHAKRTEFIKLLVLSQWSRQAGDVSKLIDLQGFIRTRHMAYNAAIQRVADMKRDLVRAQIANPDLNTALEVLSAGLVSNMPDLGYRPPRPLSPKALLRTLRKINRIISTRILLHDSIPASFNNYRVHDGRVTFVVAGEFEIDLSIAEEDHHSQFYFIDIRFLFLPSSFIPKGRFFNELDMHINEVLRTEGLTGCFNFVHNLVLSNKINILFKQAVELSRGQWAGTLRVELLHRTLVIQYWTEKSGPKSWLEVGIKSGRQRASASQRALGIPHLGLRWIRESKEVDMAEIRFDTETLSIEKTLRSAVAIHTSYLLRSAYDRIYPETLFAERLLSIKVQMSTVEPGNCQLGVQLTKSRYLNASVEPVSGSVSIRTNPTLLCRLDKGGATGDDVVGRIARLRCIAAMEEVESNAKILGWEIVDHKRLKVDIRRLFPNNILRASFFRHRLWEPSWIVAATTSLSGDDWWVLDLRSRPSINTNSLGHNQTFPEGISIQSTRVVSGSRLITHQQSDTTFYANLEHSLTGILAIYSNASWLAGLGSLHYLPAIQDLQLGSNLEVPSLSIRFNTPKLPRSLRIEPPAGIKRKSYINDTICLRYQGIDPRTKAAIVVAHGRFHTSLRSLGLRMSRLDDSVIIRREGAAFAMRFLVPPGQPVITQLCERVQRLEIVLSIFESLRQNKITVRSLSLKRLFFLYGSNRAQQACIIIHVTEPDSVVDLDPAKLRTQTEPLFRLRLDMSFDQLNLHSRIRQSLAAILNHSDSGFGIRSVLQLLTLTLPLLKALDRLVSHPSHDPSVIVQVSARGAKAYLIHYIGFHFRFLLKAGCRHDRIVWILKDGGPTREKRNDVEENVYGKLQEKIYRGKGDGWQGLGSGAMAEADQVGNLIMELDSCFANVSIPVSRHDTNTGDVDQPTNIAVTKGFNASTKKGSGNAANLSKPSTKPSDLDVITID